VRRVAVLIVVLVGVMPAACGSGSKPRRTSSSATTPTTASTSTATTSTTTTSTTTAPPPVGPPAQAAPATESFGISVNRLFNDGTFSAEQIDAQLRALQRTGAGVARSDAIWGSSEPAAPADGVHHYDWSFDDSIAGALAAHDLLWLPIIDYSAPWDESIPGQDHSPPASVGDYAQFAGAFAARYGPGGSFWSEHPNLTARPVTTYEIWNEPDGPGFWLPAPDPGRYSDLYLTARAAITAVQPGARVIVGGLTHPAGFLPEMLAARPQLAGHIDGVAIHPYGNPLTVLAKVRDARRTLVSLGLGSVPLYVTEFGWTTEPVGALDYAPADVRPGYVRSSMTALGHLDCGLAAAILYTWVTPESDPGNLEDWYGIHPPRGGSDPSTAAFAAGVRAASAPGRRVRLCSAGT
jgi:hypothetical protein